MSDGSVAVTLTKAEALILFDLLADFHEESSLQIRDQADRIAMWRLSALLERSLVEIFSPKYQELLSQAREELISSSR